MQLLSVKWSQCTQSPIHCYIIGWDNLQCKNRETKKKNVYLYLRFYSHTPTVYTIFKTSTMSYKILNQGWRILEWVYWCALNFHLILLGSTISQKDKENNKQKINGITGWRHCDEYIRQVAWHLIIEGVQATDWHKHMYLGLSICPKLYENQPLDIHSCQKKLVRNSWQLICTS